MGTVTSTSTLAPGASRTFNLAPGSAVSLTLLPNCRVTVTETPAVVASSPVGGNAPRTHNLRYNGVFTYGPYPMGGTVVVSNDSNSGSTLTWTRTDSLIAEDANGVSYAVSTDGILPIRTCLLQMGVPVAVAPTGTMGANGAVTLGTTLTATYPRLWLYLPAGAAYSGSAAGFYWTVMSSGTAGTVYNNVYTPGSSFEAPTSPTAIVDAGPGAFTGATTAIDVATVTVPAGMIGKNGSVHGSVLVFNNNSGNNKVASLKLGATSLCTLTQATNIGGRMLAEIHNAGSEAIQVANSAISAGGNAAVTGPSTGAIDTSAATSLTISLQHSTATDVLVMASCCLEVLPGA